MRSALLRVCAVVAAFLPTRATSFAPTTSPARSASGPAALLRLARDRLYLRPWPAIATRTFDAASRAAVPDGPHLTVIDAWSHGTETGTGPRNSDGTQGRHFFPRREVPVGGSFLLCQALLGSFRIRKTSNQAHPLQSLCARNDEHRPPTTMTVITR